VVAFNSWFRRSMREKRERVCVSGGQLVACKKVLDDSELLSLLFSLPWGQCYICPIIVTATSGKSLGPTLIE